MSIGSAGDVTNRREVAERVVVQILEEARIDHERTGATHEQRVAICGRSGRHGRAYHASGARAILYYEWLAEDRREPFG